MEQKKQFSLGKYLTRREMDVPFFLLVITLLTIGLVMLLSASYTYAYYNEGGNSTYYFTRQLIFALIGIVGMLAVSRIKYEYYKYFAVIGMAVSIILLLLVLVLPEVKPGFKRWIEIPGVTTFQPSEIAKMGLIMFCAWGMDKNHRAIVGKIPCTGDISKRVLELSDGKLQLYKSLPTTMMYGGLIIVMSLLVYLENHVSGTILMLAIGVTMLWLGEFKARWFVIALTIGALAAAVLILKPDILKEYAGERITAWLDKDYEPLGARWQTNQSIYAIGSGGFLGAGLGNSKQKHLYVSEPQNDFIFSIVCEELGFVGSVIILILFALLIWRGIYIAVNSRDRFAALLASGMCFQVGIQVALNVAVVSDLLPNTGISLPFFSSGGTSLFFLLLEMGVVLGVSRYARIDKVFKKRKKTAEAAK